jgi:hypothetical protein
MSTDITQFQSITVERDGFPPLKFQGFLIAKADNRTVSGPGQNRWTTVTLYRTKGGKIVAKVKHSTQWEGEHNSSNATSVATAKEAIEWLKNGEDRIGRVSQEAIERAADVDDEFKAAFVEEVD